MVTSPAIQPGRLTLYRSHHGAQRVLLSALMLGGAVLERMLDRLVLLAMHPVETVSSRARSGR